MLNIGLSQAIPSLVEAILPRFTDAKICLAVTLDLRDNLYSNNGRGEISAATIVRMLFHRPSNYTKVLVDYKFNNFHDVVGGERNKETYYKKYSDHDSCWRSDGMHVLNEHWINVEDHFKLHPNDSALSRFYTFSMFDPIKYVEVDLDPVRQTDNHVIGYNVTIKRGVNINEIYKYLPKD